VDELITELANGATAVPGNGAAIAAHVGAAAFDQTVHSASEWAKVGPRLEGRPHPCTGEPIEASTRLTSLEAHTAKRILEGRWLPTTKPENFLRDLQAAARRAVRVKVGVREGPLASTTAPLNAQTGTTHAVVAPGLHLFVVYSARKRRIVSGYSEPEQKIAALHAAWKNLRIIPA